MLYTKTLKLLPLRKTAILTDTYCDKKMFILKCLRNKVKEIN